MSFSSQFDPTVDGSRGIRVVIFYSDIAAADRALRSVRDSLRRDREPRAIEPMLWNVALLEETQWLRLAAADVTQADLCVLSLGTEDETANDAAAWLRELAPRLAKHWVTLAPFEDAAESTELVRRAG
ncbi:MAG: hypothetical protein C0518_11165 [Opitutus sp.]|nr:hypothetical protein [Opitutus sp.]